MHSSSDDARLQSVYFIPWCISISRRESERSSVFNWLVRLLHLRAVRQQPVRIDMFAKNAHLRSLRHADLESSGCHGNSRASPGFSINALVVVVARLGFVSSHAHARYRCSKLSADECYQSTLVRRRRAIHSNVLTMSWVKLLWWHLDKMACMSRL